MEDTVSKSLLLLAILLVAIPAGMFALPIILASDGEREDIIKLTWRRTGGFMGLAETLVIEGDGSATYTSDRFCFCSTDYVLSPAEVEELMDKASLFSEDRAYAAKAGVADYFIYKLTLQTDSDTWSVDWVDDWAAEETIPNELLELQSYIEDLIERIRDSTGHAVEKAIRIARAFIVEAPTFSFDGIPETLRLADFYVLEIVPEQYVITFLFESRYAGYGDRTGIRCLVPETTPHEAVVTVVEDEVVSAVLDGVWDEVNQEPVA